MKIPIRYLRWVLVLLYVLVVVGLVSIWLSPGGGERQIYLSVVCLLVATQVLFICGVRTIELCRPIKRYKIILPVAVASLMMAVLAGSASLALGELIDVEKKGWAPYAFWTIILINWIGWAVLFFAHCSGLERYHILKRLTVTVLAGRLLEFLASVVSHIIVTRKGACLAGMYTAMGIAGGICVMLWTFGPGILLLFLRERLHSDRTDREQSITRDPEAQA